MRFGEEEKKYSAVHQNSEDVLLFSLWIRAKLKTITKSFQGEMSFQRIQ